MSFTGLLICHDYNTINCGKASHHQQHMPLHLCRAQKLVMISMKGVLAFYNGQTQIEGYLK